MMSFFMSKLDVKRLRLLVFQGAVVLFLMSGCVSRPDRLEYALEFAGKNRTELEKVLEHYKEDTMKYRAACFLIEKHATVVFIRRMAAGYPSCSSGKAAGRHIERIGQDVARV